MVVVVMPMSDDIAGWTVVQRSGGLSYSSRAEGRLEQQGAGLGPSAAMRPAWVSRQSERSSA